MRNFFKFSTSKPSFWGCLPFKSCPKTGDIYTNPSEIGNLKRAQRRKKTEQFRRYLNRPVCVAPQVGLEPTTLRLTAACSANWAIEEYYSLFYTRKITALPLSSHVSSFRQLSTLPGSHPPSTIDVKELNFCVRHGNRWFLLAIVTGFSLSLKVCTLKTKQCFLLRFFWVSFLYLFFLRFHSYQM